MDVLVPTMARFWIDSLLEICQVILWKFACGKATAVATYETDVVHGQQCPLMMSQSDFSEKICHDTFWFAVLNVICWKAAVIHHGCSAVYSCFEHLFLRHFLDLFLPESRGSSANISKFTEIDIMRSRLYQLNLVHKVCCSSSNGTRVTHEGSLAASVMIDATHGNKNTR